jgi:hypothetical protein
MSNYIAEPINDNTNSSELNKLVVGVQDSSISKYRKLKTMTEIWETVQEQKNDLQTAEAIIKQYKSDNRLFNTLMMTKVGMQQLWQNIMFIEEAIEECQADIDNIETMQDEMSALKAKKFNQDKLANLMKVHAELLSKAESLSNPTTPTNLTQINLGKDGQQYSNRSPFPKKFD